MKLTRRDALIALGGLGLASTAWLADRPPANAVSSADVDDLVALAETLYPAEVEPARGFVETYVAGQRELDPDHAAGVAGAVDTVRRACRLRTGVDLPALPPDERGVVLRSTGADRVWPEPDGTDAERVRYYVVNNLLYAFYTSRRGGEYVGNPNPPGYPGGTGAYQEAPPDG